MNESTSIVIVVDVTMPSLLYPTLLYSNSKKNGAWKKYGTEGEAQAEVMKLARRCRRS